MGLMANLQMAKVFGSRDAATLSGDKQLIRKLSHLKGRGAQKATDAGLRAALTPVGKALRAAVNASGASPELKRAARASIGQRFQRRAKVRGKVGFGVGKPAKKKRMTAHQRNVYGQGGAGLVRGVGVSATNIHWFVLGTDQRVTSAGRVTGSIEDVFSGVTDTAVDASIGPALEAARAKMEQVFLRESRKQS